MTFHVKRAESRGSIAALVLALCACAPDPHPTPGPTPSPVVNPPPPSGAHRVVPIIFVPTNYRQFFEHDGIRAFYEAKVVEAQQFFARHNGNRTFLALPVEVVYGHLDHLGYWGPGRDAFELNVLLELQQRGYPVHVDWGLFPSHRVVWVLAMGAGGWAGGRHYPTGGGFAMWGDTVLFAGMDLHCDRVLPTFPGDPAPDNCRSIWLPSGQIYGFGVGAAIHELGHGFDLPHPPEGSRDWPITVMGYHWNYPNTGLSDRDRSILATSPFFQESLP